MAGSEKKEGVEEMRATTPSEVETDSGICSLSVEPCSRLVASAETAVSVQRDIRRRRSMA